MGLSVPGCSVWGKLKSIHIAKRFSLTTGRTSNGLGIFTMSQQICSEQLNLFAEAFHANQRVAPGSDEARQMTVGSGQKLYELYEKSGRHGSCLKMCVGFLLSKMEWSSSLCFLTWKEKVTKSKRLLFQLARSMPSTKESGSGLLPTPQTQGLKVCVNGKTKFWYPTPTVQDSENDGGPSQYNRNSVPLNALVKMWPTPSVKDVSGGAVEAIETPTGWKRVSKQGKEHGAQLHDVAKTLGGSLNPNWVEWLMGFPVGWTACGVLETQLSRKLSKKSAGL